MQHRYIIFKKHIKQVRFKEQFQNTILSKYLVTFKV